MNKNPVKMKIIQNLLENDLGVGPKERMETCSISRENEEKRSKGDIGAEGENMVRGQSWVC